MSDSCMTCRHRFELEKWDYSRSGVPKEKVPGFVCDIFASEGLMVNMVGGNPEKDICECYAPRMEAKHEQTD